MSLGEPPRPSAPATTTTTLATGAATLEGNDDPPIISAERQIASQGVVTKNNDGGGGSIDTFSQANPSVASKHSSGLPTASTTPNTNSNSLSPLIKRKRPYRKKIVSPSAWTLPTNQSDIRTLIQSFPEEQFLVWGYEMEAERQRRTALRLTNGHHFRNPRQSRLQAPENNNHIGNHAAATANQTNESSLIHPHHVRNHLQQQQQQPFASNQVADLSNLNDPSMSEPGNFQQQQQQQADAIAIGNNSVPLAPIVAPTGRFSTSLVKLSKQDLTWAQRFQELVDYKIKHGDCDVPDVGNGKLSTWVSVQRTAWKSRFWKNEKSSMTDERNLKLTNLGFRFEIKNQWETRFQQLLTYKEEHGHVRVPQHYKQQGNLGMWVKGQRAAYRHMMSGVSVKTSNHHKLDSDRIQRLSDLGFEWVVKGRKSSSTPVSASNDGFQQV